MKRREALAVFNKNAILNQTYKRLKGLQKKLSVVHYGVGVSADSAITALINSVLDFGKKKQTTFSVMDTREPVVKKTILAQETTG